MAYRIAVDTGGTFTDVVVTDPSGTVRVGKSLTTPQRIFAGIEAALGQIATAIGIEPPELLAESDLFIYATTRATNATVERTTARTGMLVTEGFADVLVLREGGKSNAFDFSTAFPEPYVPRHLTFEVPERIDSEGEVVTALDEAAARLVVRELGAARVEAVGVCLLWSIANPAHEALLAELIEQELPGVPYTLSHRLNPTIREYRRASSVAIDASLKPLMQAHLTEMEADLRAAGFTGETLAATSGGGVMHVPELVDRPIYAVRAGPAMAPVAGRTYAEAEGLGDEMIVCDTGGTSFDVSLVRGGEIKFTREAWLGERFTGDVTGVSSVDVKSIGAGGGSIAWIDPGGLLRVGPISAGAEPGPACYGRGGDRATVTDAAAVLGYLDPDFFLGGRMALRVDLARAAVARIAEAIDADLQQAAHAIVGVASENMVEAIHEITIQEGVNPRESLLLAGGGAAGLNIVPIAEALGCRRVLVPRTAGALSACGIQHSDVKAEYSASHFTTTADFDHDGVGRTLAELEQRMDELASSLAERGLGRTERDFVVEARYAHQAWQLDVALTAARLEDGAAVESLVEAFHREHERVFAVSEPGQTVECVDWKGRLTAFLDHPGLPRLTAAPHEPEPIGARETFFPAAGRVEAAIHHGEGLGPGSTIAGPAIVEEPTTTIVVYPGATASVTALGNYLLELE
ncbi:MAG: hydantoinase/oxoprolinase family protein [Thermoleophilaceae bacterium]